MNRALFRLILLVSGIEGCLTGLLAQPVYRVEIVHANSIEFNKELNPDAQRLIGDVVIQHAGVTMFCDSAWFFSASNSIDAYSRIHFKQGDTLHLYGDLLHYDGNTRIAQMRKNVKLVDKDMVLHTEALDFDINKNVGYYTGGGVITNDKNKLKSDLGYYYTHNKDFFFQKNVEIDNPSYTIHGDTMKYNTISRVAWFFGPTHIYSDSSTIYCENGWYNTQTDIAQFNKHSILSTKTQWLAGDSLYYEKKDGHGRAFMNVMLYDSVQKVILKGQYGEYYQKEGHALLTDSTLMIKILEKDSMYVHADTLWSTSDSAAKSKTVRAYYRVKIFKNDMQAKCDSLSYSTSDSTLRMNGTPVLWSDENQLTSEVIEIHIDHNRPRRIDLLNTAFITSKEDSGRYNQIRGKKMIGYIDIKGELKKIDVIGNGQTIYYTKDGPKIIGVNHAESTNLAIYLQKRKVNRITFITKPNATLYPLLQAPPDKLILKGFQWLDEFRPKKIEDIFRWN